VWLQTLAFEFAQQDGYSAVNPWVAYAVILGIPALLIAMIVTRSAARSVIKAP